MKNKRLVTVFVISLSLVSPALIAQTILQPGTVVLLDGNQKSGLIDYREWRLNPRKISFSETADGKATQYSVADLASFTVYGKDSFVRAVVSKDMRPVEHRELVEGKIGGVVEDTVFLRILVQGAVVALYELVDSKPHYYIREKDGAFQELVYEVTYNSGTLTLDYRRGYRNQLQKYAFGHAEQDNIIASLERAEYKERQLTKVVAIINSVKVARKKDALINFFVAAGPAFSSMKTQGEQQYSQLGYQLQPGFTAGGGMDVAAARNMQDLIFRLELFYSTLKYKGTGSLEKFMGTGAMGTYTLQQNNITPSIVILYNFIRKNNLKIYAAAGFDYHISSYSENVLRTRVNSSERDFTGEALGLYPSKSWMTISLRLGTIIDRRWEVTLAGRVVGAFDRAMVNTNASPSFYSLKVGYRFKTNT